MVSTKALLAEKLKQNTQKHQQAQTDHTRDAKEFRRNVSIADIERSPYQPRQLFNESDLKELANSIEEVGLLQPITLRKLDNLKYQLIAGERRLRAHQHLGKSTIEAIILDASDTEASLLALAENLKRQDLTDYEVFLGLNALDESLKKNKQRLAKSLGLNREDMYKYLAYSKLPERILIDLNADPSLLGRTAATAFKKFLTDHVEELSRAQNALLTAWEKVKVNTLEQTKAVKYAESLLADEHQQMPSSVVKKITYRGKVAGNIKLNNDHLKISLHVSKLEEQDLTALENYLIHLLEKTKV